MKMTTTPIRLWIAVLAGSTALTGYLCAPIWTVQAGPNNGEMRVAMALFGGDDQKPVTLPPKPPTPKPQTPPPATPVTPAPVGGAKESPKPPDAAVPPSTASAASPTAEVLGDGYSYDPKSRRDPFHALTKAIKKEMILDVPPLQRYQLSDVKILGIVWGGYGYYGLIQTPDGKGYTVKEGMLMGTNNGVIKAITDKAIIVSEPTIDFTGKKIEKEVELLLRPKEVS